jgi:hypothetical protein
MGCSERPRGDCMHPSVKGLESIAEQTWNAAEEGGLFLR